MLHPVIIAAQELVEIVYDRVKGRKLRLTITANSFTKIEQLEGFRPLWSGLQGLQNLFNSSRRRAEKYIRYEDRVSPHFQTPRG